MSKIIIGKKYTKTEKVKEYKKIARAMVKNAPSYKPVVLPNKKKEYDNKNKDLKNEY